MINTKIAHPNCLRCKTLRSKPYLVAITFLERINICPPHPSREGEHSLEYRVQIIALIEVFHEL